MYLTAVLPANAQVVTRGGPGREAWGHSLEASAQYNHMTEGRKRPPVCPWRIEVGDPNSGTRSLFLHVFEIGGENDWQPANVKLVPPAGVDIGGRWRVQFSVTGALRGQVNGQDLATSVHSDAQYAARAP